MTHLHKKKIQEILLNIDRFDHNGWSMTANQFIFFDSQTRQLLCQGEWNISHVVALQKEMRQLPMPHSGTVTIDGKAVTKMDTAGAWLLNHWITKIDKEGVKSELKDFSEYQEKLLSIVKEQPALVPRGRKPLSRLESIGKYTYGLILEAEAFLSFTGKLALETLHLMFHPYRMRWRAVASVIETTGFNGLPIIALLSFMIGIVIAYQMGLQLQRYGANIFIVNLLGLSVLREFGPLLTAIMVAGRTGSAFTAQIGTMKINQEIDALDTMGVTPDEILVLPRLLGLFIVLPLLTIWADIFGIIGGMIMAQTMLNITWVDFLQRFASEIPVRALLIGLGKAPVFAMLIGSIGCFQGMQVSGSADSVGKKTTRSVVLAIFFIIVTDALFSIIFSKFKL